MVGALKKLVFVTSTVTCGLSHTNHSKTTCAEAATEELHFYEEQVRLRHFHGIVFRSLCVSSLAAQTYFLREAVYLIITKERKRTAVISRSYRFIFEIH